MRVILVGASPTAVGTAEILIQRKQGVVIVERDKARIDALSENLDCAFIHGDGTKPAILRETTPGEGDVLMSLTDDDQANILASLVGRSLGFTRVITKIDDPEFEHICRELGLVELIIPQYSTAHALADTALGITTQDYSALFKGDVRLFAFVARDDDAGPIDELKLPDRTRAICLYRAGTPVLPDSETTLETGDEVILLTTEKALPALRKRWARSA